MKLMKSQMAKSISCTVERVNFNRQRLLSLVDADLIWGGVGDGGVVTAVVWLVLFGWRFCWFCLFLISLEVVKNTGDY